MDNIAYWIIMIPALLLLNAIIALAVVSMIINPIYSLVLLVWWIIRNRKKSKRGRGNKRKV